MDSEDKKQGGSPPDDKPDSDQTPVEDTPEPSEDSAGQEPIAGKYPETTPEEQAAEDRRAGDELYDPYDDYAGDPYGYDGEHIPEPVVTAGQPTALTKTEEKTQAPPPPPPPAAGDSGEDEEDEDDDGMLRMSFMDHLDELRSRIIKALTGVGVAFFVSVIFANDLWQIVSEPAVEALTKLGYENAKLAQIKPMETFTVVWVKLPILAAVFLSSPWILYQVWAFIAPGLYKRERHWASPFVICSAGLFILGGLFAYFVAFRFGLSFLLGIGRDINIAPYVSVSEYFDLFVNVTLGIGLVFQMPVLIFFLTLLRIVTPGFLLRNARYAILIIVVLAAIITPTPDVVNLMLFAVPMALLFFVGILAGYILTLHREERRMPWWLILTLLIVFGGGAAGAAYFGIEYFGLEMHREWPFLRR
jgi:sec-independent protein translocase protein TatC